MSITKKELIEVNKQFGGNLVRSGSLDYGISRYNHSTNKFNAIAYIIRAIVIDHPFSDGNKRTAIYVCNDEFGDPGETKLSKLMVKIARENITDIPKIEKMLRRCYQKN